MDPSHRRTIKLKEKTELSEWGLYIKMVVILTVIGSPLGSGLVFGMMGAFLHPLFWLMCMLFGLMIGFVPALMTGILGWVLKLRHGSVGITSMTIFGGIISVIWGKILADRRFDSDLIISLLVLTVAVLVYCRLFKKMNPIAVSVAVDVSIVAAVAACVGVFKLWGIGNDFWRTAAMFGACGVAAALAVSPFCLPPETPRQPLPDESDESNDTASA